MSFNITPVASGYQEIHPYSAMNIDSVKINTSLIMMKEWEIHPRRPKDFPRPERNLEGREKSGGRRGWISQYLPSFGGVRTISQHQFFHREWIRSAKLKAKTDYGTL